MMIIHAASLSKFISKSTVSSRRESKTKLMKILVSLWWNFTSAESVTFSHFWDCTPIVYDMNCDVISRGAKEGKKTPKKISSTFSNLRNSTDFATQFKIRCSQLSTVCNRNPTRAGKLFDFNTWTFLYFSFYYNTIRWRLWCSVKLCIVVNRHLIYGVTVKRD